MKDFLGKELKLGDLVVVTEPQYRNLVKAKIVAFTPKKVRIEYRSQLGLTETDLSEPNCLVRQHMVCEYCGATDYGTGSWGALRKPCKGVK